MAFSDVSLFLKRVLNYFVFGIPCNFRYRLSFLFLRFFLSYRLPFICNVRKCGV